MTPFTIVIIFIAWIILLRLFPFKQKTIHLDIQGEARKDWRSIQDLPEDGVILVGLVLRHEAGGLTEVRNDLFIIVDITAIESCNIAAFPLQMAADLSDFLIVHGKSSLNVRFTARP